MSRAGVGSDPLLDISGLRVSYPTSHGWLEAVGGVDLSVDSGKVLALVGESGCGKSATVRALIGLGGTARVQGSAMFDGVDLLANDGREARRRRGHRMAMIFQDPMTTLDPTMRIENQVAEPLVLHKKQGWRAARKKARDLLEEVQIRDVDRVARSFPHQLSGGMRQRVVIAMALACGPELVFADEPTTALDVTVQAEILQLLADLQSERGMTLILITHDMGVVRRIADDVAVMYAGQIVERAPVSTIFADPTHPYTRALTDCMPPMSGPPTRELRLQAIPGSPPDLVSPPEGCRFCSRCPLAGDDDPCSTATGEIPLLEVSPGHWARTLHPRGA